MNHVLKVGIDIHGVIDTFPQKFALLSRALVVDGAEVHIVTGVKRDAGIDALLQEAGVSFTHYFSIVDYLEASGEAIEWIDGLPYADEDAWNSAKRNYCHAEGIDFLFDDSDIYRETFHDIECTFLHVVGPRLTEVVQASQGKRRLPVG